MAKKLALLFAVVLVLTGCTTSFTNMTPTRALEPLDFEVSARAQAQAYSNVITKTLRAGDAARGEILDEESTEPITEEQFRDFVDAGVAFFLFRPGVDFELAARIGLWKVLEGLDLGVRYDFNLLKGDLKLQFWESENGRTAASVLAGVGKQTVEVPGAVEWLTLTEWSRTDFDFQASVGYQIPDILHLYFNPRVLLSSVSIEHKISDTVLERLPEEILELDPHRLFRDELMVFWGATLGGMVGYKYVFLALELNIFKLEFEPTVINQKRNFDSLVLAPAIGLVGTW